LLLSQLQETSRGSRRDDAGASWKAKTARNAKPSEPSPSHRPLRVKFTSKGDDVHVALPSEEMKGRIYDAKAGTSARSSQPRGINVLIDEPASGLISGFDPSARARAADPGRLF